MSAPTLPTKIHSPRTSLRQQLLAWLLPLMLLLLLGGAGAAYFVALRMATQAYDRVLMDAAFDLAGQVQDSGGKPSLDLSPSIQKILLNDQYDHIYYAVADATGQFVAGQRELLMNALAASTEGRYYDTRLRGEKLRAATVQAHYGDKGSELQIIVAETLVKRHALTREIWLNMLLPELLLMLLTLFLLWFGVGRGLRPLERLGNELAQRSHVDLSAVDSLHVPEEVQPLVTEINQLLQRLDVSIQAQRAFVSDAAHQIRTPIAALQAQVELALRQHDDANLPITLKHILAGIQRITHLSNQLLTLARSEPGNSLHHEFQAVDLHEVAISVGEIRLPLALNRNIDLGFEIEHATLQGSPLLLGEMLGNLLDNALQATPIGGHVTVRVHSHAGQIRLEVEDDGPGIAEAERERIFERFYRPSGSPEGGCGLGLAIVREIARLHAAQVSVSAGTHHQGACFCVTFNTPPGSNHMIRG